MGESCEGRYTRARETMNNRIDAERYYEDHESKSDLLRGLVNSDYDEVDNEEEETEE